MLPGVYRRFMSLRVLQAAGRIISPITESANLSADVGLAKSRADSAPHADGQFAGGQATQNCQHPTSAAACAGLRGSVTVVGVYPAQEFLPCG